MEVGNILYHVDTYFSLESPERFLWPCLHQIVGSKQNCGFKLRNADLLPFMVNYLHHYTIFTTLEC